MSYIDKDRLYQKLDSLDNKIDCIDNRTVDIYQKIGKQPLAILTLVFVVFFSISGVHYNLYTETCQKTTRLENRVYSIEQKVQAKESPDTAICREKTANAD